MSNDLVFRSPNAYENDLVMFLLEQDFPGSLELREQFESAEVAILDIEGSLKFSVHSLKKAPVENRIPIEAFMMDVDNISIRLLLHVLDGFLHELEIYKDDGSSIQRKISVDQLKIFSEV